VFLLDKARDDACEDGAHHDQRDLLVAHGDGWMPNSLAIACCWDGEQVPVVRQASAGLESSRSPGGPLANASCCCAEQVPAGRHVYSACGCSAGGTCVGVGEGASAALAGGMLTLALGSRSKVEQSAVAVVESPDAPTVKRCQVMPSLKLTMQAVSV
jgi:hypothetical protein